MSDAQTTQGPRNRGMKIQIWIMLIMVGGVMVAGTLMQPKSEEDRQQLMATLGTTNQGQLVKPAVDARTVFPANPNRAEKWKIVVAGGDSCDAACNQVILDTRSVHILMGKLVRRAERVYLANAEQLQQQEFDDLSLAHPHLTIQTTGLNEFTQLLKNTSAEWDMADTRYFVVTPDAEVILYYTQDDDVMGLLEDMKHLLKYSPDR
ncbi:hypothetical protein NYF23_01145 [SAR92 clade bacterium H455]|uniref:Transmembrane protein n=1 Tax=SAR92 clade bacterium H455 TaxID=2974818 RepID=A0ABY5TQ54_9GAMM|nr:hypothetical protein NYF23_01145 [SAR92 clade bacterium H455]